MSIQKLKGSTVDAHLWVPAYEVESSALDQLRNIASLPWAFHVAVMPDVHYGKGATVGSVIALKEAVSPAAVGVDLGCGMLAAKTNLNAQKVQRKAQDLFDAISARIPVGFTMHGDADVLERKELKKEAKALFDGFDALHERGQDFRSAALKQCGTLGGGNHFIEVCLDTEQNVWLMLHSGSRRIGKELAEVHIKCARKLTHNAKLPDKDLAVFLAGTPEMAAYRRDLYWAQQYAALNRRAMFFLYMDAIREFWPGVKTETPISCHHNYVAEEVHFGEEVFVTRKGAISARQGEFGIIPGCLAGGTRILMADGSYRDIEALVVGDQILCGHGRSTECVGVFARGPREVWWRRNNRFHSELGATPDHMHWVGDLSTANTAAEGRVSILERPTVRGESKYKWASLEAMPNRFTYLMPRRLIFSGIPSQFLGETSSSYLPTYELGFVFGAFLGNGTARYKRGDGGQVSWSWEARKKRARAVKLIRCVEQVFDLRAKLYKGSSVDEVVVHNAPFARIMCAFGKRTGKSLPRTWWCSEKLYLTGLLDGLIETDGHFNNGTAKFTNTSKFLMEQFGIFHYMVQGYLPSVSYRAPNAGGLVGVRDEDCHPSYRASLLKNPSAILTPLYQLVEPLKRPPQSEVVDTFDIEVACDCHSFVANNVVVHNSMGAQSFIVRGLGNPEALHSASHGAGRKMSRGAAKRKFTKKDLEVQTKGVVCRKDKGVIDEIPGAYKDIAKVMAYQSDLVEIVATLKQIICVKGAR